MQVHKVIVQVDGWQELQPVSIDKVGTFFRHARARKDDGPLVGNHLLRLRFSFYAYTIFKRKDFLINIRYQQLFCNSNYDSTIKMLNLSISK